MLAVAGNMDLRPLQPDGAACVGPVADAVRHAKQRDLHPVVERPAFRQMLQAGGDPERLGMGEPDRHIARHAQRRAEHDPAARRIDAQRHTTRPCASDESDGKLGIGMDDGELLRRGHRTGWHVCCSNPIVGPWEFEGDSS